MPRTGRPTIAPASRKAGFLTLRLSEAERDHIEQAAQIDGKRATTWARDVLLAQALRKAG